MSNNRNRDHHSLLAMPGMRVHCVRVRRMMGRKHQLLRRHCSSSVDALTADQEDVYYQAQHMDSTRAMSSALEPNYCTAGATTETAVARAGAAIGTHHSSHRRHQLATERRLVPNRFQEDSGSLMSAGGASPFLLGYSTTQKESVIDPILLPLPPVVSRIDMAGSPFSPFSPSDPYNCADNSFSNQRLLRSGLYQGGARAHSSGGGGSGGGGGSDGSGAIAPPDMSPGGGDAIDGETPSEYTFRRRNAIVEGSEDAPKADDFPSSSPK